MIHVVLEYFEILHDTGDLGYFGVLNDTGGFGIIWDTRSYAALRAADLDWIIGPGYSLGGYILEKNHEKTTWNHEKP